MKGYYVVVIVNLVLYGFLVLLIIFFLELLNNFVDSGVLVYYIVVIKRLNIFFCILLCRIKRMCIVVSIFGDNMFILSIFLNLVEYD